MRCPTLTELPPPPPGRTGWPWTEESRQLPDEMPVLSEAAELDDRRQTTDDTPSSIVHRPSSRTWPRISIVTPSYNQGQFIEETIRSVLLQGYPNLEYMVIDGGSTDESVEIIKRYEPWLTYWVSEEDRGQSHAINKGWERATGEIMAYLNSDDIYFLNALATVAIEFHNNPDVGLVTGGIASTDEHSNLQRVQFPKLPPVTPVDLTLLEPSSWFLPQASSFMSRKTLSSIGAWVREDLHYTMDRELFYRMVFQTKVHVSKEILATYRHHPKSKTSAELAEAYKELPRAFSYCKWGTSKEKKQRSLVLQKRKAEGYYFVGKSSLGKIAFIYLLRAVFLRPKYLIRKSFLKNVVKKVLALSILR